MTNRMPELLCPAGNLESLEAALHFVRTFILVQVPVKQLHNADYKTQLQELVQQKKNQVLAYGQEVLPDDEHLPV